MLPNWLNMEKRLSSFTWFDHNVKKQSFYNYNPTIHSTVQIWRQVEKQFKLRALSFTLLISANPSFTPSAMDGAFDQWRELGLCNAGGLYIYGTLFRQLQEKYGLSKNVFF